MADQDPLVIQQAMQAYVRDHVPAGIEATVTFDGPGVRPCLTPLDAPALQAAARAMGRWSGRLLARSAYARGGPT